MKNIEFNYVQASVSYRNFIFSAHLRISTIYAYLLQVGLPRYEFYRYVLTNLLCYQILIRNKDIRSLSLVPPSFLELGIQFRANSRPSAGIFPTIDISVTAPSGAIVLTLGFNFSSCFA